MRDRYRVVRVERRRAESHPFVGHRVEQRRFLVSERAVVREHEHRVGEGRPLDDRGAVLMEFDDGPVLGHAVQRRLEAEAVQRDAGAGLDRFVAHRFVALFEGAADERGRRALVGVEPADGGAVEDDGVGVVEDEVDAGLLPDPVGETERGGDAPTEDIEAAGAAGEVVERELGGRRGVVSDDDKLAHTGRWGGWELRLSDPTETPIGPAGPRRDVQRDRLLLGCALAVALLGLCVHYDATVPVDTPGNEELATDYDRYVGETVAVSVVVRGDAAPDSGGETASAAAGTAGESNATATGVLRGFERFGPVTVRGADRVADPGGTMQVRGRLAPDRTVVAERVLVVNPYSWSEPYKYAVSVVGAVLVLVVFFREWRPDVDALAFEVRDDG